MVKVLLIDDEMNINCKIILQPVDVALFKPIEKLIKSLQVVH